MHKRQSDSEAGQYTRSETRTFQRDGAWYFSSREGDFGPFPSLTDAEREMQAYVGLIDLRPENEGPVTPD